MLTKPFRTSATCLAAGLCCTACLLLVLTVIGMTLPKGQRAVTVPVMTEAPPQRVPGRSLGDMLGTILLSALPLVPPQPNDAPLVAAVIENHEDARPHQRGIDGAIAVFELIVEGDISRFLAFFRADALPEYIGPVRSPRTHIVDIALGYKPFLLHAGGHHLAYEMFEKHPELLRHDGIRYDGETYERDPTIARPHNLFMSKKALLEVLETYDVPEVALPLFENQKSIITNQQSESARTINVNFGSPTHNITFTYKPLSGTYNRATGGAPKQAEPTTIAILETHIEGFGDRTAIPWTQTFGGGKMLLFAQGNVREGRWVREKGERFAFFDATGEPLGIARGQTWVMLLPDLDRVSFE